MNDSLLVPPNQSLPTTKWSPWERGFVPLQHSGMQETHLQRSTSPEGPKGMPLADAFGIDAPTPLAPHLRVD